MKYGDEPFISREDMDGFVQKVQIIRESLRQTMTELPFTKSSQKNHVNFQRLVRSLMTVKTASPGKVVFIGD
jgi:hypothetical protein